MSSEITRLLEKGESETVEFKGPQSRLQDIGRAVCGMLNQQGGVVLWGVTERRKIVGIADAAEEARCLNEYIAKNIVPRPLVSVSVETEGGHDLVVVDVPAGADKPYALTHEIWIRIAHTTLRATAAATTELVERSAIALERWERELMPGFSLADCNASELQGTRADLVENARFGIVVPPGDEDLLRQLNMSRSGGLTNGSVVLFARSPRRWAPNLSLRITSFAHARDQPTTLREPIGTDTILEGPAVGVVRDAVTIIQQRTGFSGSFEKGELARRDRPAYALFALREGLVNAIVHRDYGKLGHVSVEIYSDSLHIQNPGRLPDGWTVNDFKHEHVSKPMNPDIARVFYLRGLMEQLGMGTQRLIEECKRMGAKVPVWTANKGTVSLTLYRAPAVTALTPRQSKFLARSKPGRTFNLRQYAQSVNVSERQARRDLGELVRLGILERIGRGPATSYRLQSGTSAHRAPSARGRAENMTSDEQAVQNVDSMVRWFFERYEDPANGVPFDSAEGGYQYIHGGPYDAEQELSEAFADGSTKRERLIKAATKRIEHDGTEWVKRGEY